MAFGENLGDIASQLATNDTNYMLASLLLEQRVTNIILAQTLGLKDEIADIRNSLTIADFTNQSV